MHIQERVDGDIAELNRRIRVEREAEQRDRYRVAVLAIAGQETSDIQAQTSRSRGFVQRWAYAYRDHGLEGLIARPRGGSEPKLSRELQKQFVERFKAGPTERDGGVCRLGGKEGVRILEQEFGVAYSLNAVYELLHRNGQSCLRPRPRHRKSDLQAQKQWLERPPFVQEIREKHPEKQVEVWFQDEARFGQQGTLTTVWADRGSRPWAIKQTEYDWIYLFAAVNPVTGDSSAMLAPTANTDYMNAHLEFISRQAGPNKHVVLVLDQAGWHVAKALRIPENITLFHLTPYSPELNAAERIWAYLRSHYLSNRVFRDYDDLLVSSRNAWNSLSDECLRSVCRTEWIMHEVEL